MVEGTFFKEKNCDLYLLLATEKSLKRAAKRVDLSYRYASFLINRWIKDDLISKEPRREMRYVYTPRGLEMRLVIEDLNRVLGEMKW
jgi:molybdenum-dependent DNA-binding transcriptional regulator ModE